MSGLCMAAKLQDAGIDTFTIFEKADEVGGTWRDNTYPGCRATCRRASTRTRSAPTPTWSRFMSPGPEIQAYFRQVADERGIRSPHPVRHRGHRRRGIEDGRWWVVTTRGEEAFDVLVTATGVLRVPRYPDIPGLDTFAGPTFHSCAVGPFGVVARQADRIDRHGLDGRADHRGTRR